ncbi:MAG: hypothetical protein OER92_04915, partial [Alphaproteobacteria bacterium]|nr:hypothetical protein [Alphaproteobacteria bacterium]
KVGQLAGYPTEDGEGITVTEQMIDQMIENLHASPDPIPVDGAGVSEVHGTVDNTATEAAGWVFDARKEQGADGLAHMHLLLELRPDVMAKIKAGGFKFGSIAFVEDSIDRVSAKPTGAVLDSYAITNKPFVQGLQPHLVMSTPPAGYTNAASTAGSLLTTALSSVKPSADARRVRLSQPSEVLVSDAKFTFARINQVEKAILEAAGITGGEIPTEELGERLLMKIVEMKAKAGITDPPPAAKGKGADLADDEDEDDKAALAARALQEGAGAVADQVMSMLMEAFQLPAEAPPETLLELLTANLDAIKAAVAGAPAADPNAEPGGAPVEPPALSPPPTLAAQPGPRVVALEAEVLKLRAEANAQKRIETEEFVTRAFDERGLNLDDKARTLMVDACLEHGREHLTNHILEGIKPKAPQGRVFSDHRPRRATVGATVDTEADPFLVRVNECVEELRPKHTGSDKALRREAFNLAQSRHPELVRRG